MEKRGEIGGGKRTGGGDWFGDEEKDSEDAERRTHKITRWERTVWNDNSTL